MKINKKFLFISTLFLVNFILTNTETIENLTNKIKNSHALIDKKESEKILNIQPNSENLSIVSKKEQDTVITEKVSINWKTVGVENSNAALKNTKIEQSSINQEKMSITPIPTSHQILENSSNSSKNTKSENSAVHSNIAGQAKPATEKVTETPKPAGLLENSSNSSTTKSILSEQHVAVLPKRISDEPVNKSAIDTEVSNSSKKLKKIKSEIIPKNNDKISQISNFESVSNTSNNKKSETKDAASESESDSAPATSLNTKSPSKDIKSENISSSTHGTSSSINTEKLIESNKSISSPSPNKSNTSINSKDSELLKTDGETSINKQQIPSRKSETTIKDFFKKTSQKNQNMAWEALSAFVGGIILWFVSICLTCWNEKRAVRTAELADYVNDEKKVVYIENGSQLPEEKYESSKAYMVSGKLQLNSEAKIDGLNLDIKSDFGQILILKLKVDKFSKTTVYEEKDATDRHGNNVTEVNEKTYRNWNEVGISEENGPITKYFYGDSLIGGNYKFDVSKLNHLFTFERKHVANYEISEAEISALQDYYRSYFKTGKFFLRSKSLFVINSNPTISDNQFDPQKFDFTSEDYKISILYYYLPKDVETHFTAIGSLSQIKNGIREFGPFETDIKNAEFCYLCCYCQDSSYMKLDTVLTQKMTREKYYEQINNENNSATWILRLVCYLLHFGSYYLILYPIIMIVGMIPYLGAIGATVLIFVAFLVSLVTFLFIIACAWICARPLRAIILFGIIGILIFVGKSSSDHIKAQYNNNEKDGPGELVKNTGNSSNNMKFL